MQKREIMFVHEASMNIHDLSQFSMEAGRFASCIQIQYGKKIVNAKSMVLVLSPPKIKQV